MKKKIIGKSVKKEVKKAEKKPVKKSSAKVAKKPAPKAPAPGRSAAVDAFMAAGDHPFRKEVEALRVQILKADKRLAEQVKWKAPSYSHLGVDMGAFNLWNRDIIQFVFLLPMGKAVKDPGGILEGNLHNRRLISWKDGKEVKAKANAFAAVVQDWVQLLEQYAGK